jgi:hypothetical protein
MMALNNQRVVIIGGNCGMGVATAARRHRLVRMTSCWVARVIAT